MEANYVHKDSTTLVQDKLVKNELNQIELQYNALKQQKFNELLKENQELKNQQKEFIKWLKDNIDNLREIISDNRIENNINHLNYLIYKNNLYTEILQKYKEIIGGKE